MLTANYAARRVIQLCLKARVFIAVLNGHTWRKRKKPSIIASSWLPPRSVSKNSVFFVCLCRPNKLYKMGIPVHSLSLKSDGSSFMRQKVKPCLFSRTSTHPGSWKTVFLFWKVTITINYNWRTQQPRLKHRRSVGRGGLMLLDDPRSRLRPLSFTTG